MQGFPWGPVTQAWLPTSMPRAHAADLEASGGQGGSGLRALSLHNKLCVSLTCLPWCQPRVLARQPGALCHLFQECDTIERLFSSEMPRPTFSHVLFGAARPRAWWVSGPGAGSAPAPVCCPGQHVGEHCRKPQSWGKCLPGTFMKYLYGVEACFKCSACPESESAARAPSLPSNALQCPCPCSLPLSDPAAARLGMCPEKLLQLSLRGQPRAAAHPRTFREMLSTLPGT